MPQKATIRLTLTAALVLFAATDSALAAEPIGAQPPPPLSSVSVPAVPGLYDGTEPVIVNRAAAIALGKALFWDTQVGSDGQACASCHFNAGADNRVKNVISPGLLNAGAPSGSTFQGTASGAPKSGPNYTLNQRDFPFHKLSDPGDRNSSVISSTDDVASSPGTFAGNFVTVSRRRRAIDVCDRSAVHPIFNVGGIATRKVEPRNTPTMINAALQYRSFWDGRANNLFNGNNPFGPRDVGATIIKMRPDRTVDTAAKLALINSALASQAVGPPLSDFEMSCANRTFPDLGRKLLAKRPLALQRVHPQDSVLGVYRRVFLNGIRGTYADLVRQAFNPVYWAAPGTFAVRDTSRTFSQMEANFAMFWGLAIQAYEATLISNQAPYDRSPRDLNGFPTGLSSQQQLGLSVFLDKGHCINCHKGPDFTGAGFVTHAEAREKGLVERMIMGDGGVALYDTGFYNIGVTPTGHDIGVGGLDPFGNPLSFAAQYLQKLAGGSAKDRFEVDPCTFEIPVDSANCSTPPAPDSRVALNGAFKVPSLRNVEYTGPYMHNGSMATLEQVVEFYNRGGNFVNSEQDPDIQPLGLTDEEKAALVAFLKALTDPRVALERAPFDHPQLTITNGHLLDENVVLRRGATTLGQDQRITLPAVGRNGRLTKISTFVQRLAP